MLASVVFKVFVPVNEVLKYQLSIFFNYLPIATHTEYQQELEKLLHEFKSDKILTSSIGTTLPGLFGKPKWVEPELEGDVSAAPFGDGCKKGIRGAKDR